MNPFPQNFLPPLLLGSQVNSYRPFLCCLCYKGGLHLLPSGTSLESSNDFTILAKTPANTSLASFIKYKDSRVHPQLHIGHLVAPNLTFPTVARQGGGFAEQLHSLLNDISTITFYYHNPIPKTASPTVAFSNARVRPNAN